MLLITFSQAASQTTDPQQNEPELERRDAADETNDQTAIQVSLVS